MAGPTLLAELQRRAERLGEGPRGAQAFAELAQQAEEVLQSWASPAHLAKDLRTQLLEGLEEAGIPQLLLDAAQAPPLLARVSPALSGNHLTSSLSPSAQPHYCSDVKFGLITFLAFN